MRFRRIAFLLLATAPGVGCGAPTQPPTVASVTLAPGAADMTVGASASFTATVRDSVGNVLEGRQVFWASEDTSIVSVSDLGVVTAIRPGTTRIAASAEGRSDVATVTVQPADDGDDDDDDGHGGRGHRGDQGRDDRGDDGNDGVGGDL